MPTLNDAGKPANVTVSGRTFTLTPIPMKAERVLWKRFAALVDEERDNRAKRLYAAAMLAPTLEMQAAAAQKVVEMLAPEVAPNAQQLNAIRKTAKGVVEELLARTRETHPDVLLKDFQALVTDVNAEEANEAINEALDAMNPNGPTP